MKNLKIFILIVIAGFIGCEAPADMNPPGDNAKGYLFHVDTNLYLNGGYYSISLFNAENPSPFNQVPVKTDSLKLTMLGADYYTFFTMNDIPAGKYYLASTWSSYPRIENEIPIVLGTYGCDTIPGCTDHKVILYPNYEGNFRNFSSYTDINKGLY